MKSFYLAITMCAATTLLSGTCGFAAEKTEKSVAFRTTDNRYVTATAKGGLNTSGAKIAGNQTFVLVDLNGGDIADGDTVQIKWAPAGSKPTYWGEGEGAIGRYGGRPGDASTFKIKLKEKSSKDAAGKDAPLSIVLQTASGKFVSVPGEGAALATTDAADKATTLEIVAIPQDAGGKTVNAPVTAPAPNTPAPGAATVTPPTVTPSTPVATITQPPVTSTPVTSTMQNTDWKFDFGSGPVAPGYTQVLPTSAYSTETGYGLEPGAAVTATDRGQPDALQQDFLTSDRPFLFSVAVPEGNYNVKVTLGDQTGESNTTVKAEQRRLMLENVNTAAGKFEMRTFTVNVHTPKIPGNSKGVSLKPGEWGRRSRRTGTRN